jgi:uncharacterized iron-regulated membrane protein
MQRSWIRCLRQWLYLTHRWVGVVTCLLFAMWFVSGVVMFPNLTDKERLAALPPIAWDKVMLSPDQAMRAANAARFPQDLRLNMMGGEPVYRLADWEGEHRTISAVDGRPIESITPGLALAVARLHPAAADVQLIDTVDRDQWTVTARYDRLRPLFLISLGDPAGTELYVSSRTGEIALDTTRTERIWNWLGSIPHWIYPTVLRKDGPLWRQVVLWMSGICMIVAVSGIWIGVLRIRFRRYASGSVTPYRGWMAWHHMTGFFGGIVVLTWMFSGWLSLNPGAYFAGRGAERNALLRYAGQDAPDIAARLQAPPRVSASEARFVWRAGRPLMLLASTDGSRLAADPSSGAASPLSDADLFEAARRLMPATIMIGHERLREYDAYWYSHHQERALPVLRVAFDDEAQTWFHIDPATGDILGRTDGGRRAYRWLFNALHSFDFPMLLSYRPAWDAVVWLLSIVGMIISFSGVVIGWRYLRRASSSDRAPGCRNAREQAAPTDSEVIAPTRRPDAAPAGCPDF